MLILEQAQYPTKIKKHVRRKMIRMMAAAGVRARLSSIDGGAGVSGGKFIEVRVGKRFFLLFAAN